jgi:hypothetical protein
MVDPELLRQTFEQVLGALRPADPPQDSPLGHAVLHGEDGRPVAIILVIDDPEVAARFAALLPQLQDRLGVAL